MFYKSDLRLVKWRIRRLRYTERVIITRHSKALPAKRKRQTTGFHSPTRSDAGGHIANLAFVIKPSSFDAILQSHVVQNITSCVGIPVRQTILKCKVVFLDVWCWRG